MTLELRKPGDLDDLLCKDGEVEDGDWLFPESGEAGEEGSGGDGGTGGDAGTGGEAGLRLSMERIFDLPEGFQLICLHKTEGERERVNAVMSNREGRLYFLDVKHPYEGLQSMGTGGPVVLADIKEGVGAGAYLVLKDGRWLHYAKWEPGEGNYLWLGEVPNPPAVKYTVAYPKFPPYSLLDGDYPNIDVGVELDDTDGPAAAAWLTGATPQGCREAVRNEVKLRIGERVREFVKAVSLAGMHLYPLWVSAGWELEDGSLWLEGAPEKIQPEGEGLTLSISTAVYMSGTLRIRLGLSRRPYRVTAAAMTPAGNWSRIVNGMRLMEKGEQPDFIPEVLSEAVWLNSQTRGFNAGRTAASDPVFGDSDVLGPMEAYGNPDRIEGVGGRLFCLYPKGETRERNYVSISDSAYPFARNTLGEVPGGRLIRVEHSMRQFAGGRFGEFPLYAFSSDGVRALTPKDGRLKDVQLISRDVALDFDGFAPLERGVCFLTKAGVKRVEGTSVNCLYPTSGDEDMERVAFIYAERRLVCWPAGSEGCLVLDMERMKWTDMEMAAAIGSLPRVHYAWPDVYLEADGSFGAPLFEEIPAAAKASLPPVTATYTVATRPVKFGSPFTEKKLMWVEGISPSGVAVPVTVYGAVRPGVWHLIGRTTGGKMRLRGSGWRLFRFETAVLRRRGGENVENITFVKPLIYCKIREYD